MSVGGSSPVPGEAPGGDPGSRSPSFLPDVLTGSRFVLGPLFALSLPSAPGLAFVLAGVAAATDFVDGRLARRLGGGSSRGAALDVVGDGVFVLCGLGALAWARVLAASLPVAAAVSLLALARVWHRRPSAGDGGPRGWPDSLGHVAGILNYGAVFVGAGFVAFEVPISLHGASVLVAVVNVAPIAMRWGFRTPVR